MASTNFLVFDEGKQNMMRDGDYSANTQRARGVTPGIAYPNLHNKLYYQVSVMAKAIADFMVAQGANASDEDVEQLTDDISNAFTNFVDNQTKDVYLPLSGGTMKGNINASGYNITATKFIGNLQGKADSAANADLAAKATTAENANNANNSSVANKLGTSTVGSATKPVYINNGVASAVSVDLSTLAPKESPALSGTPTAPTPATSVNNTQLATTAFVQSLLSSRFTASKNDNGWWKDGNTGMIFQFFSYKPTTNYKDAIMPAINFPISFPNKCILVLPVLYNDDSTIYHDIAMQPVSTTNSSVIFYSQLHEPNPLQNITGTTIKALAIGY